MKICLIGLVMAGLLTTFAWKFMGYHPRIEKYVVKHSLDVLGYLAFLVKEVIVANLTVMKMILSNKKPRPVLYQFKVHLDQDASKTLLANSITLTPGTITVLQDGDEYVIHSLDFTYAEDIGESPMYIRVHDLEEKIMKEA